MSAWIGRPDMFGRNRSWTHPDHPGLVVRHCGHPTALWPYYVDGLLRELGTFRLLKDCQAAAIDHMTNKAGSTA